MILFSRLWRSIIFCTEASTPHGDLCHRFPWLLFTETSSYFRLKILILHLCRFKEYWAKYVLKRDVQNDNDTKRFAGVQCLQWKKYWNQKKKMAGGPVNLPHTVRLHKLLIIVSSCKINFFLSISSFLFCLHISVFRRKFWWRPGDVENRFRKKKKRNHTELLYSMQDTATKVELGT